MLIHDAEIAGRHLDLRIRNGRIAAIGERLAREPGEPLIEARGGALIPGLHDHHLHLFSLAASLDSIACGPPRVESRRALRAALRRGQPRRGWLRGTGYFESVAGPLDRDALDAMRNDVPLRIQHRSGSMWFLNSRAVETLGLETADTPAGIERDASGRPTGRLFRCDDWIRERLPPASPDLAAVGAMLARFGVTRVTDATPGNTNHEADLLSAAQRSGALPQRVRLMGSPALRADGDGAMLEVGEVKLLFDESALPALETSVALIREAHAIDRAVAIHTVTRTEMHFALAALEAAGARAGDRLEHASIAPPECIERVRALGLSVVTQPNFVAERGDAYRVEVEAKDLPHLYLLRSWLDHSVPLAGGTDAPFGDPDPWHAIRAAVTRETPSGRTLGKAEGLSPETALRLFCDAFLLAPSTTLPSRPFAVGRAADFCVLDAPWREVRLDPSSDRVAATVRAGEILWSSER